MFDSWTGIRLCRDLRQMHSCLTFYEPPVLAQSWRVFISWKLNSEYRVPFFSGLSQKLQLLLNWLAQMRWKMGDSRTLLWSWVELIAFSSPSLRRTSSIRAEMVGTLLKNFVGGWPRKYTSSAELAENFLRLAVRRPSRTSDFWPRRVILGHYSGI